MDVTTKSENLLLAEKLRNEDPEQFFTLVRMHLSFVLDLNTDDCDGNTEKKCKINKWNLPFTKKQKPGSKTCFEGTVLNIEFIDQMKPVIEFLRKEENICQEGIFRRSGRVTRQQELKMLLHQGVILNFNDSQFSVHECATVLKNILSELPESVLTDAHYPAYCQIAEFCNGKSSGSNERLLRAIQLLILLLPSENRMFFKEIIELLHLAFTHESKNRMSADNLATLFTPHLLCPRKLSPEALHTNSQVMSRVVAFMIETGSELFHIPPTVATDVRAYWNKKEKRKNSPLKQLDESICDGTAANTVFTFVDREKTAEENRTNPTETALAQLYAYIQALPESSKKRKLIKQFNKENGYGTPLRTLSSKKRMRTLNLGDSIKKHLSGFSKTTKRNMNQGVFEGEDEEITSPDANFSQKKCQSSEESKSQNESEINKKKALRDKNSVTDEKNYKTQQFSTEQNNSKTNRYGANTALENLDSIDDPSKDSSSASASRNQSLQELTTKGKSKRCSSSPIEEVSASKASHLTSDKDIPLVRHMKIQNKQGLVSNSNLKAGDVIDVINESDKSQNLNDKNMRLSPHSSEDIANKLFVSPEEPPLPDRMRRGSLIGINKLQIQKYNVGHSVRATNNDVFLSPPNNTNRLTISHDSKSLMMTSTPAPNSGCLLTPIVDRNNSMSPITKSARRMPKAMQETMMTPRSRKPVISLSGTDLCNLVNSSLDEIEDSDSFGLNAGTLNSGGKKLIMEDSGEGVNDSLSSPFRNYLFTRSVLTASPVDLSFSSRTDDFLSLSEKNSSQEIGDYKSLPEMLNGGELSESLLFCLDGNEPAIETRVPNGAYKVGNCSCSSYSECDDNVRQVYETAL
ncbi:hypothetical protein RUM44_000813 [Polyplax serrata]|uniref:Rho-GAP domain-containing protein n=1 Tax=Polyplax serrata TaxID=468196 RepID=A0ABR1B767_POLSC